MRRKWALVALVGVLLAGRLWSFGSAETGDYQPVEGQDNWTRTVDTAGRKEGTYNLIVRAEDRAGNVSYGGPINIRIDPDSDLPLVNVSNPTQGMRVGNNLNVLGTCVDDDAVERVEISVDGGSPVPAEGREYWSYYLDVSAMADGSHTLAVRGIDSNGLEGRPFTVAFALDKRGPTLRVESHKDGALLNSRVVVSGVAEDGNGIAGVSLSRDGRKSWEPLKVDVAKGELSAAFRFEIDAGKLEAGPHVYWLRAADKTGSDEPLAFLFFVDNEPPKLEILSPAEDAAAASRLVAIGTVADDIAVKSLSYSVAGGPQGAVTLTPGNRYWVQAIDPAGIRSANITFTAEDVAGNRTQVSRKVSVDSQADLPVVKVIAPASGASVPGPVALVGSVRDDSEVKGVEISVDGGAPRAVETREAFVVDLEPLQPGPHRVVARGLDAAGLRGPEVRLEFVKLPPAPRVEITQLIAGEEGKPFAPGLVIPAGVAARLVATASAGAGPLEVRVGAEAPRRVTAAERFEIALAKDMPAGRVDFSVRAAGSEAPLFSSFAYKGQATDPPGLIVADARIGADGRGNVGEDRPLRIFVSGGSAVSAEADPRSDRITVEASGSIVTVTPRSGGSPDPFRIKVTTDSGTTLVSEPLVLLSDVEPPQLTVSEPLTGAWVRDTVKLSGSVAEPGGLKSLEVSTGGTDDFRPVEIKQIAGGAVFDQTLSLAGEDGVLVLTLRAEDLAGNQSVTQIAVNKDTVAPLVAIIAPGPSDPVEGTVTLTGQVVDAGVLESVELSDDGTRFVAMEGGRVFHHDLDLSVYREVPKSFAVRATDRAGNAAAVPVALSVDQSKDRPVAEIQIPEKGSVQRGDFVISGMAFDDDGVRAVVYRLDGGDPVRLEVEGSFSIPLSLASLADNEHRIEVVAEDIRGVTGDPVSSTFVVSTADPVAAVAEPKSGQTVRGHVLLEGSAEDKNGIRSVAVSFDNGNTFNKAEGAETWSYPLNTTLLKDGTHAIQIRVADNTGTEALYSTLVAVDNTPPELALSSLSDGDRVAGSLLLDGRAHDALRLASLRYQVRSLEKAAADPLIAAELPPAGVFAQRVDVSALNAGWYNLELAAVDAAANTTTLSRNFAIQLKGEEAAVVLLFPADGEKIGGEFTVDGRVHGATVEGEITLLVDGAPAAAAPARDGGWFTLPVSSGSLTDGQHKLVVRAAVSNGRTLESAPRAVEYAAAGPWLSFTGISSGDYVSGRPLLTGKAGIAGVDAAPEKERAKSAPIAGVELSFDSGRTFVAAKGGAEWQHRLDTSAFDDGELLILARARSAGGEQAVRKLLVIVDDTPPDVRLGSPSENARFNASVFLAGTAADENGLAGVTASFREGGKGRYQVPGFIQGLYLDAHAMGATYGELGFGFTFFDDNVRLQMQVGPSPEGRFSGLVIGTKLLANILSLPFSYWFGPAWDFFSMSFALGANFSYFSMSEEPFGFGTNGLVLAAVVIQWEMARFDLQDLPMFSFVALYTEGNLWFISSDISGGVEPRLCFGLRAGVF